jgi:hypothetical protein
VALQLRAGGAQLADVFTYLSSLYFRGKFAYGQRFGEGSATVPGVLVITPNRGLMQPSQQLTMAEFDELGKAEVRAANAAYADPLRRDAAAIEAHLGASAEVVLLGSIATGKYIEPLLDVFGQRLLFPRDFVGRGDMSRGALLLRCARDGTELEYASVASSTRHGPRAERLATLVLTPSSTRRRES